MQGAAHVIASVIAFFIWNAIGGIGGLIVAVLAVGLIEIVVHLILAATSAPFRDQSRVSLADEVGPACSECDGTGTKTVGPQHTVQCLKCGGTGIQHEPDNKKRSRQT